MANYRLVHVHLANEKVAQAEWLQSWEAAVNPGKGGSERRLLPSRGAGFVLSSEEAAEALGSGKAAAGLTLPHQHHELPVLCSPCATNSGVQECAGAKVGFSWLRCSLWWCIFPGSVAEKLFGDELHLFFF